MSHYCLEYVWIDGYGTYRSKTKSNESADSVEEYLDPIWNYDGSSTNQAAGTDSEVLIRPRVYFPDSFRRLSVEYNSTVSEEKGEWIERCSNRLVLCDTWLPAVNLIQPIHVLRQKKYSNAMRVKNLCLE